jgi:hypothetical protein
LPCSFKTRGFRGYRAHATSVASARLTRNFHASIASLRWRTSCRISFSLSLSLSLSFILGLISTRVNWQRYAHARGSSASSSRLLSNPFPAQ